MPLENSSRKALYAICAATPMVRPVPGDVLSLDLSPKEDGQPVIVVTFSHNTTPVLRVALPCASIAALQMYPFITVMVRLRRQWFTMHGLACLRRRSAGQLPLHNSASCCV